MEEKQASSSMSASLLARDVYCVCFPERDGLDSLHGEFAQARKKFFSGGKKAVKVGKSEIVKGFNGKLHGKLSRHAFYWKKSAGKLSLEEVFDQRGGQVLVRRDFRGVIVSRAFFDRERRWIRSEYYEPWDSVNARVTFKPSGIADMIERFDREEDGKRSRSTELFPIPYLDSTAEQSILNARFGEPRLIVSTAEGEFCYCPQREAEARKRALEEIKNGTIVLMPAWEVKEGSLTGESGEEETNVTFTSLEEYARIEAPAGEPEPIEEAREEIPAPLAVQESEEFTAIPSEEPEETVDPAEENVPEETEDTPALTEDELILEAARKAAGVDAPGEEPIEEPEEAPAPDRDGSEKEPVSVPEETPLESMGYSGTIREGKIEGRGRTEQQNGLTAYDGEYRDGRREGFGSYYYKDGNLCYAGFWKDDKKDGLGVSFRDTDHALHIAKWENGQPGSFVSLYDKDGNLRYGGRIENGKKEGAGVSFSLADGSIFVGQWENGQPTGLGSSFDKDGNLLYYGGWKDGKRSGHGTEFDKNGSIVFDGEWKDGKYHNGILYRKQPQNGEMNGGNTPSWDL